MNTLTLRQNPWFGLFLAWFRRPAPAKTQTRSRPVVRIAGLR